MLARQPPSQRRHNTEVRLPGFPQGQAQLAQLNQKDQLVRQLSSQTPTRNPTTFSTLYLLIFDFYFK